MCCAWFKQYTKKYISVQKVEWKSPARKLTRSFQDSVELSLLYFYLSGKLKKVTRQDPTKTTMILSSITPKCGAMRGGERITIRGQNFVNDNVVVVFTSIDKSIKLEGIAASYTNPKVIEVSAPNCSSLNSKQGLKNWAYVTVSCGGNKCKNRRKYTYLQKCQIVRKYVIKKIIFVAHCTTHKTYVLTFCF